MIVCLCSRVSDRDIERAVQAGARSLDEVTFETGACTNCQCCSQWIEACIKVQSISESITVPACRATCQSPCAASCAHA